MCSSLTMNTDIVMLMMTLPLERPWRVLMDGNPDNEPQLANVHEHLFVGNMCDCVISQAVQGPGEKNFTDHTGASLASKLHKFDEEGVLDPEHGELSLLKRLRSGAYKLHKQCYDRFNDSKLQRVKKDKKNGKITRRTAF